MSGVPSIVPPLHLVLHNSFDIPAEYHETLRRNELKEVTLEGDIQPDEHYLSLLNPSSRATVAIPQLSQSIIKLNLGHFTWGFPIGFLSTLGERLPDLKCLRLYRQNITGPNADTRRDAQQFLYRIPDLVDLYLSDVHGDPDFFIGLGKAFKRPGQQGLVILHVEYTFEDDIDDFILKLPIPELRELIHPAIADLNFNMNPKPSKPRGIVPWPPSGTPGILEALLGDTTAPQRLKELSLLRVAIRLERPDIHLVTLLAILTLCPTLQAVEIVTIPSILDESHNQVMNGPNRNPRILLPTLDDVRIVAQSCPNLRRVYTNFSRVPSFGTAHWYKEDGVWKGGIEIPENPIDFTVNQHM
ncbi:Hypothetical protein PENO1_095390 [Penicillium occitanis (nom. inval.)]|nr:Hypothetical protein PENO1_095390 [Penicillium occitanis (nom. inval.)]PCG91492.1 hypothetical protein PENOC_097160 [Penicillium occitanis (nom. inval.)]